MKKISSIIVGLLLTVSVFAGGKVTFLDTKTANEAKQTGVFHFEFDDTYTVEQINKAKVYYEKYFTVSARKTDTGINVTIKVIDPDDEIARRIEQRFFVTLDVKMIDVMGTDVELMTFLKKFVLI